MSRASWVSVVRCDASGIYYEVSFINPLPVNQYYVAHFQKEKSRLMSNPELFIYEGTKEEPFYRVTATKFMYELTMMVPEDTKVLSHSFLEGLFKHNQELVMSQVFSSYEFSDVGGIKHSRVGEYLLFRVKAWCQDATNMVGCRYNDQTKMLE